MIVKKREKPLQLEKLEALLRRIPPSHPKYPVIKADVTKRLAGYKGEQSLDYFLNLLPEKQYSILHDLRLHHPNNHFFQIDTLLLSPSFILILEVKNIAGTLYFDPEFNQLIRTQEGKEEAFPDPQLQIHRQKRLLKEWLIHYKVFVPPPIDALIVISNPSSVIRTTQANKELQRQLIRRDFLPQKIEQLERQFNQEHLTVKELNKITRLLKKHHTPSNSPILDQFQLTIDQIQKGVFCPGCGYLPMKRVHGTWRCLECEYKDRDAHTSALIDFSLLINSSIVNHQARDFLLITHPQVVKRILQSMNFPHTGSGKGRVYTIR